MYVCECGSLDFRGKVKQDMAKGKKLSGIHKTYPFIIFEHFLDLHRIL